MHRFTKEQQQFIKDNAFGIANEDLKDMFNKTFNLNLTAKQIKGFKNNNKITSGLTGRFEKGQLGWNKGMKWNEFMSKQGQINSLKTTYKKGSKSHNCDPIGTEKWKSNHANRDDEGFLYVKVADGKRQHNWKQKHRLIWEEANGPIPKAYKVIFADGDRTNIKLSNLILVSNAQMLIMNKNNLIYEEPEATISGSVIAKIIDKTNKIKRNKKEAADERKSC